ncbi:hypothetical protein GOP47_0012094 [Adiantum capillus-veneris]|uniref:Uncharacterized protein n=1 Tax=Adiantum capillus-veneris TaxID=13818 RepID=A0A9D4URE2_ADICA|nr:hypothetical protein GOP47_0012094 [Adiantum capillus-veneris]
MGAAGRSPIERQAAEATAGCNAGDGCPTVEAVEMVGVELRELEPPWRWWVLSSENLSVHHR